MSGGSYFRLLQHPDRSIVLSLIGIVRTPATDDEIRARASDIISEIQIFPEFREGLDGVERYSHIFVIAYFHKLRREQIGPLKVQPRGLLRSGYDLKDIPFLGVLSLDSPTRPNPIGLTLAKLHEVKDGTLRVSNLDYFDGTPVLDIKPYRSIYRVEEFSAPSSRAEITRRSKDLS